MLRKFFIIALLFLSPAIWATPCSTVFSHLQIQDSVMMCRLDTLRFESQASLMYEWRTESETNPNFTTRPYFIVQAAETVWVTLTDSAGANTCTSAIRIHLFPFPEIISRVSQADTTLCFGDSLTLKAGEVSNVNNFHWEVRSGAIVPDSIIQDSTTLEIIFDSPRPQTVMYVAVFTGHCIGHWTIAEQYIVRDTAIVHFANPPILDLGMDTIKCYDDGFELTALAYGFEASAYNFRWNNLNQNNQNAFTVTYENQGMQRVEVWHEFCYSRQIGGTIVTNDTYFVRDSVAIRFYNLAWTNPYRLIHLIARDTAVCDDVRIILDATVETPNLTTYRWSGLNIRPEDTLNPAISVPAGSYTVTLRDSAGCEREFTVNIRLDNCEPSLEMPNVFTPNNDGRNDYFRPMTNHRVYNFQLRIYNRAGRLVYEFDGDPDDPSWRGWNGKMRGTGTEVPTGTYFWAVRYNDIWGRIRREQGTVTLLR